MSIHRLIEVLQPPSSAAHCGSLADWGSIVARLGTRLPTDYMEFVGRYGAGVIEDFLRIFTPFHPRVGLLSAGFEWLGALNQIKRSDPAAVPFPLYYEPSGVLPFGNGDDLVICWVTNGSPDRWTVASWEPRSGNRWQHFPMGLTEFLAKLLSNQMNVGWYEPSSTSPVFVPLNQE